MRVMGEKINSVCHWEQKYGVWFCIRADKAIDFMVFRYSFTEARLPELKRRGLNFQWVDSPSPS